MTAPTPAAAPGRPGLAELLAETSPAARRARVEAQTRPVLPALAPVLPDGRLPRGEAVEVLGSASLLLALAAGPASATPATWSAVVGLPDLGLASMRGYGMPWERTLLVDRPADAWAEVVSILAGACDVILTEPPATLPARQVERIAARLRATGATMLTTTPWRGAALSLSTSGGVWFGLGEGHGILTGREVTVHCTGRGRAARGRSARLLLPDASGGVSAVESAAQVEPVVQIGRASA
ncbi:hypothetical protein ACFWNL_18425 [Kitasatospora sp. NPDC058397]|uniref:hypothetical protein n=1 Tax=unclassified Kitasatospora TaxID=2633591 RepID=UPI00365AB40A